MLSTHWGLLDDVETIWLDRGCDSGASRERLAERHLDDPMIAKRRARGSTESKKNQPMGPRRVSTPRQANEVCAEADGVIVGSALVRRLLEGGAPTRQPISS